MYLKNNKLILIIIITAVFMAGLLYYFFAENHNVTDVPIIYPDYKEFKSLPDPQHNLVTNLHTDKSIYEKLQKDKKSKDVNLLPDPEAPIIVENNSNNYDVFALSNEANKETELEDNSESNIGENQSSLKLVKVIENQKYKAHKSPKNKEEYYLQILYSLNKDEVLEYWKRINLNNKKLLSNSSHRINKITKGQAVHYELVVGPYDSFKDAKFICTKMKLDKHKCIVIKR